MQHVFHLFVVRSLKRDDLKHFLEENGIQAGIHYPVPLHLTAAYQCLGVPGRGSMPVTERLAAEILSLPMYPELTDAQINYMIAKLQEFIEISGISTPMEFSA